MENICVFVTFVLGVCYGETLLQSISGEVGQENYTYYVLTYEGPITLRLYSLSGDADLYISQVAKKPTFEPDSYCLQSATCGLDVVTIPKNFHRPVRIGVYGHPSHDVSSYLLDVFSIDDSEDNFGDYFPDEDVMKESDSKLASEQVDANRQPYDGPEYRRKEEDTTRDKEDTSLLLTFVLSFIEILLGAL